MSTGTPNPLDGEKTFVPGDATVTGAEPLSFTPPSQLSEFGRYQIIGEIARGGVGVVYRAKQKGLERIIALKVLQGGTAASPEKVKRFLQEAQSAAKLQHPNIVPIHDFGEVNGEYFFTMDFVEGESLADLLQRGPVQPTEALNIIKQVSEALHHAHEHGVIHRDIKPGNILIDKQGNVKVTDFGLAKEVERSEMSLTVTGQVMGTPRYMSPEQASGRTAQADRRSDIFSLGVTLYEMLTGKAAFDSESVVEILRKICTEEPVLPHKLNKKIHRDVETICLHAIEKQPDRRYQTASEMSQDVERFLAGEPIEAKPVGSVERVFRKARKHAKLIAVNTLVMIFGVYAVIFYVSTRPGHVRVQVQPEDAEVTLDGTPVEPQDLLREIELKPGQHRVHVALEPQYDPVGVDVWLRPGENRTLPVQLVRRKGVLTVATDPPDAAVTIFRPDGSKIPLRGPRVQEELPTGHYGVLVYRANHLARDLAFEIQSRATNTFNVLLPSIRLWSVPTAGNVMSIPLVVDCDGDGMPDVLAGDDDGKVYCLSGRSGAALWVIRAEDAVQAPFTPADVDADGKLEILFGSVDGKMYCVKAATGTLVWKYATRGAILGPALVRNGEKQVVVVGAADGNVYAVDGRTGGPVWEFHTNGRIESCVAWARERGAEVLLAGSADKNLYVLDPKNGAVLWKVDVGAPLLFPAQVEENTVLLPTPRTVGDVRTRATVSLDERKVTGVSDAVGRLIDLAGDGKKAKVVVSVDEGTTCFDFTGTNKLWHSEFLATEAYTADVNGDGWLDLLFNNGPQELVCLSGRDGKTIGHIAMDSGMGRGFSLEDVDRDGVPDVTAGVGREVVCYSWVGGRKDWSTKSDSYYDAPFAEVDGKVVTKNIGGEIACYDPKRNDPLWRVATSAQPAPYAGIAAGQGAVVDVDVKEHRVRALSAADGHELWRVKMPGEDGSPLGNPALGPGCVLVGDGNVGLHCIALSNGVPRWAQPVPKVTAPPVVYDDNVFVCGGDGGLYCLALADGVERWKFNASDPFPSPPVCVDVDGDGVKDIVAMGDNGIVYVLNGKDGRQMWVWKHSDVRARTRNGIVLIDVDGDQFPEAMLATPTGDVICLDLKKREARWRVSLKEQILCAPAIADMNGDGIPEVVVGTMGRRMYCLSGRDGVRLWSYELGAQVRYGTPLLVKTGQDGAPLVFVGTGPPENGLYCLKGGSVQPKGRGWSGPWRTVVAAP